MNTATVTINGKQFTVDLDKAIAQGLITPVVQKRNLRLNDVKLGDLIKVSSKYDKNLYHIAVVTACHYVGDPIVKIDVTVVETTILHDVNPGAKVSYRSDTIDLSFNLSICRNGVWITEVDA